VQEGHLEVVRTLLSHESVDRSLLDANGSGLPALSYAKQRAKQGDPSMEALFKEARRR